MGNDTLTIAIPTYNRGAIVVETVRRLLLLKPAATVIVVDQTAADTPGLARWHDQGAIRWVRLPQPSIPRAMNTALRTATTPLVLFLDDDVEPSPGIVSAHLEAHTNPAVWAVVGQILEQGESPAHHAEPGDDLDFRFNHDAGRFVSNVMAGNLSVKREAAIGVGGFDENFVGVAYRFETDFARRLVARGGQIWFEPRATLRHLKLATGGLRTYGNHLTSASPMHSVGDYYYAIVGEESLPAFVLRRLRKNVLTSFHATHPWTIPAKLMGELRGLALARRLARSGRKLLA